MAEEDPIDKMNKPELERLARRYWAFANRVGQAHDLPTLRDLLENYFRGMAEDLRGQFMEANQPSDTPRQQQEEK